MGRHRPKGATAFPIIFATGVILVIALLAIAGTVYVRRDGSPTEAADSRCDSTVRVVTASSFAPVLEYLMPALATGDNCLRINMDIVDGRAAPARAAQLNADVWIPDDAAWKGVAARLQIAPKDTLGSGAVLATSPIYMVTDKATAGRVQQAGGSWLALATLAGQQNGVKIAVRDPAGSGDGMVGAGAVGEGVWVAKGMDASTLALSRALPNVRTVAGTARALPKGAGEVGIVPEYALLSDLPADMTYLAGSDHTAMLRYTWLPTASAVNDPERSAAVTRLLEAIRGTRSEEALAAAKLRRADTQQVAGAPVSPLPGLGAKPFDVLGPHHVDHVFATWYPSDRRTSVLVVIDVSGSMAEPAPGTATPVMELVKQGCRSLGTLLPDEARIGLWEFGAELVPPNDYRVVLPPAALAAEHRTAWGNAVNGLAAKSTGTGLYDTILAAYTSARDNFTQGLPNHVFVFTDGRNEGDTDSITVAQLNAQLAAVKDPNRPVYLSVVAFGQEQEAKILEEALKPVDGYVDAATTVDEVGAAFLHVAAGGIHDHE
jgi:Bacterial extracellular solute-binding protein/von Willebrand factor type A domain